MKDDASVVSGVARPESDARASARDGRTFRVNADRTSASRRVRYVEGSMPDAENCTLCRIS